MQEKLAGEGRAAHARQLEQVVEMHRPTIVDENVANGATDYFLGLGGAGEGERLFRRQFDITERGVGQFAKNVQERAEAFEGVGMNEVFHLGPDQSAGLT